MFWIVIGFTSLAIIFWSLGKIWERNIPKVQLTNYPNVSILIPAYKSEKTIEETLRSVKNLDYPKKEVIVVNDYPDKTPEIAKKYGFRIINNKERQGKAISLNKAVKKSHGDILFFLDSDTTIEKDCLRRIIPWFSKKDVAVVAPKYVAKNKRGFLPKLVSLENSYNSTMFKMHMIFGSMISFRGCGVAIRRDVFEKMNGWSHTLIEDTDFAAKIIQSGYKIRYEPSCIVETYEPTSFGEFKKQKLRWGRGAGFAIFNNKKAYLNNVQTLVHFIPYVILNLAILWLLFSQILMFLPAFSFLYGHAFSYRTFFSLTSWILYLIFSNLITTIFVSVTIHNLIIMWPERMSRKDIFYIPLYTLTYLPLVLVLYVGGIAIGIIDRFKNKSELDFKHW